METNSFISYMLHTCVIYSYLLDPIPILAIGPRRYPLQREDIGPSFRDRKGFSRAVLVQCQGSRGFLESGAGTVSRAQGAFSRAVLVQCRGLKGLSRERCWYSVEGSRGFLESGAGTVSRAQGAFWNQQQVEEERYRGLRGLKGLRNRAVLERAAGARRRGAADGAAPSRAEPWYAAPNRAA
jgi:hypothetical protein